MRHEAVHTPARRSSLPLNPNNKAPPVPSLAPPSPLPLSRPSARVLSAPPRAASDSSFSLLAAVLSKGLVLSRSGWRRFSSGATDGMLHHVSLSDEGSFDCGKAAALWRAAMRGMGEIRGG